MNYTYLHYNCVFTINYYELMENQFLKLYKNLLITYNLYNINFENNEYGDGIDVYDYNTCYKNDFPFIKNILQDLLKN